MIFEHHAKVSQQQRLVFVHHDGRGGVQLWTLTSPIECRTRHERLETVGQIDELGGMVGRDADVSRAGKPRVGTTASIRSPPGGNGGRVGGRRAQREESVLATRSLQRR